MNQSFRAVATSCVIVLASCSSSESGGSSGSSGSSGVTPPNPGSLPACTAASDGDCKVGPTYTPAAELTPGGTTPRGLLVSFTMESSQSKVFKGNSGPFSRTVQVYVPKQYVDGAEAPLMVVQDGYFYVGNLTAVLDSLIAAKQVPAMIAVFVDPGPGEGPNTQRSYEYDRLSEDHTTFIETEVLPLVLSNAEIKQTVKNLKLTKDPNGRATMGGSSGGSAAFTMGWFRPDLYGRVLTYSGTFVKQFSDSTYPDGGWEYHQRLIGESAKKPLRVFLAAGENDMSSESEFKDGKHDWLAGNQGMAAALKAKGYEYKFVYGLAAGHVDDAMTNATLPDAVRWVWKGFPVP